MIHRTAPALLLFLASLPLQGGCKKGDQADTNPPGEQGAKDSGKTPQGPPVEVGSEQLAKEYATDRGAADAKYKNKLLQVKGTVVSADPSFTRNRIYLSGFKEKPTSSPIDAPVRCAVRPQLLDKVPLLSRGQQVQVTGKCTDGGALGVNLADCDFKELEPSSVITISAEALTKEFAADKVGADKKYKNQEMIVEGTVADVALQRPIPRAVLAGQAPWTVAFETGLKEELQQLKMGQKARIKGLYEGQLSKSQVIFTSVSVLKAK
jgi:hypothetical protein